MRCAPQSRLFLAISLINALVSADTFACVDVAFCLQKRRKEALAMPTQKCFCLNDDEPLFPCPDHSCQDDREQPIRVGAVHAGRFTCPLSMMSGWRKRAFSAMSSDLLLPRSAMVPSSNEVLRGLVQRTKRVWSRSRQRRSNRLKEGRKKRVHRKSFSFAKMGRCVLPSCKHMMTSFDGTLSSLHLQVVGACSLVLNSGYIVASL